MAPPDLCHVLVDRRQNLAHAVIELRTAVRHEQIGSDVREARLSEVIGEAQQTFIILIDVAAALDIHPLPLLTQDRLGIEGRGEYVRISESSADGLYRDRLITGGAFRQSSAFDVGWRSCRIVAQ